MPLATDVNIHELAARPREYSTVHSCQALPPERPDTNPTALAVLVGHSSRAFTGADIAAICKEAAFRALREGVEATTVCVRHFEAAWDQRAEQPQPSETRTARSSSRDLAVCRAATDDGIDIQPALAPDVSVADVTSGVAV